ncbi:MAG TPA: GNAT family N-acetyltransferase [Pseudochrobactrum sp.]|nr:GNAT family N-acetyltransferase [Pseudochrobactrum sp.]
MGGLPVLLQSRQQTVFCSIMFSPDYQYRGVSKALMAVSEGWLKEQRLVVSRLTSTATAKQFYEKLGYLPDGEAKTGRSGMPSFPMSKTL